MKLKKNKSNQIPGNRTGDGAHAAH